MTAVRFNASYFTEWVTVGGESFNLDDGEHLLSLLHDLSGLGVVIRTIISQGLNDTESYTREFITDTSNLIYIYNQ